MKYFAYGIKLIDLYDTGGIDKMVLHLLVNKSLPAERSEPLIRLVNVLIYILDAGITDGTAFTFLSLDVARY